MWNFRKLYLVSLSTMVKVRVCMINKNSKTRSTWSLSLKFFFILQPWEIMTTIQHRKTMLFCCLTVLNINISSIMGKLWLWYNESVKVENFWPVSDVYSKVKVIYVFIIILWLIFFLESIEIVTLFHMEFLVWKYKNHKSLSCHR